MYDLLNINVLETQGALQSRLGFSPIGLFNYLPPLSAHSYTSKHCQMSTLHFSVRNYHETLSLLMVYILAMFTACIRWWGKKNFFQSHSALSPYSRNLFKPAVECYCCSFTLDLTKVCYYQ